MADYAIGDIQGCFDALMRLLDHLQFNEREDRLWCVGDLVNRGPQSLEVLRFIKSLPQKPYVVLGNHDLYLLYRIFVGNAWSNPDDSLDQVLNAPDCEELGHWLRQQPILYYHSTFNIVMSHAGIPPIWTLNEARAYAQELEKTLQSSHYLNFLKHMFGNQPQIWSTSLQGIDRLRVICNYFTRMRFCDIEGNLILSYKGNVEDAPPELYPWYAVPMRQLVSADILFGHWAALEGECTSPHIYALDTGCVWGKTLTALRLQDKQRFSISCL